MFEWRQQRKITTRIMDVPLSSICFKQILRMNKRKEDKPTIAFGIWIIFVYTTHKCCITLKWKRASKGKNMMSLILLNHDHKKKIRYCWNYISVHLHIGLLRAFMCSNMLPAKVNWNQARTNRIEMSHKMRNMVVCQVSWCCFTSEIHITVPIKPFPRITNNFMLGSFHYHIYAVYNMDSGRICIK